MQHALIQRYLGNKSPIIDSIVELTSGVARPGDLVCDAFSGSLAVTAGLRSAGFAVVPNDINHFSWTLAKAYFSQPQLSHPVGPFELKETPEESWQIAVQLLTSPRDETIPASAWRQDFWKHYCEEGPESAFTSKRGQSGHRRFFSSSNAQMIDLAMSRIRHWHRSGEIDEWSRCLLTATLLTAVEKISNTQGTFHDFPRDFYDSRALKALRLIPPRAEFFAKPISPLIGKAEDSLSFIAKVPRHRVLYLDPPYNFRQYTSYYFMLNLISSYAEIDDLDEHFAGVQFVRGQNMQDDFKSTFCSKSLFVPSLRTLVEKANADFVILSYFDGRNHWGEFKQGKADVIGRQVLEGLLTSDLFVDGSLRTVPVSRTNYQSYGGFKAKTVQEFLFVAEKASKPTTETCGGDAEWTGTASAFETTF
jgi:adenine-specific DNA-methyltransferase